MRYTYSVLLFIIVLVIINRARAFHCDFPIEKSHTLEKVTATQSNSQIHVGGWNKKEVE